MGVYGKIKETTKAANDLMNMSDINELRKQLEEAKEEIKVLKEQLKDKDEWEYNKRYNLVNADGREICGTCYETEKLTITVSKKEYRFGKITFECPKCKNTKDEDIEGFDIKKEMESWMPK